MKAGITGFGVLGEIIMERGWLISVLKRAYMWVINTLSTRVCISTPRWLEAKDGVEVMNRIDLVP